MDGMEFPPALMSAISAAERTRLVEQDLTRHARKDALATLAGCDVFIEAMRCRLPELQFSEAAPYSFLGARGDCAVWAEYASDGQIAWMLETCLQRIGGARVRVADRKRLMVALWNGLPPEDRRAFSEKVMKKEA
jgi:hypothetical protein